MSKSKRKLKRETICDKRAELLRNSNSNNDAEVSIKRQQNNTIV